MTNQLTVFKNKKINTIHNKSIILRHSNLLFSDCYEVLFRKRHLGYFYYFPITNCYVFSYGNSHRGNRYYTKNEQTSLNSLRCDLSAIYKL